MKIILGLILLVSFTPISAEYVQGYMKKMVNMFLDIIEVNQIEQKLIIIVQKVI